MAELVVVLPEGLEPASVRVHIHMEDGPGFEAIVGDAVVTVFGEVSGRPAFRWADVTLECGHAATVFGRAVREGPAHVEVVVRDAGV